MKTNENQPKIKMITDIPPGIRTAKASLSLSCAGLDAWCRELGQVFTFAVYRSPPRFG